VQDLSANAPDDQQHDFSSLYHIEGDRKAIELFNGASKQQRFLSFQSASMVSLAGHLGYEHTKENLIDARQQQDKLIQIQSE
jgi:hypothetical protein